MDNLVLDSAEATPQEQPVKEYTADGLLKVKLSARAEATIHELNGYESLKADAMVGGNPTPLVIMKLYACFALSSLTISGSPMPLPPTKNDLDVYGRARLLTGRELMMLMTAYADEFMSNPLGDDSPNQSTPQPD